MNAGPVLPALSRRRFLLAGGGAVLLVGAGSLASCASSDSGSSSSPTDSSPGNAPSLGSLALQLGWVMDYSAAGSLFAKTEGYYKDAGFSSIDLIPGGANSSPPAAVVSQGKALLGVTSVSAAAAANAEGASLRCVATVEQKSPFCVMTRADAPFSSPQDMIGKTIGVQDANTANWNAFLGINKIDQSQVKVVPAGYDPTEFTKGKLDGWVSYVTDEPVALEAQGFKTAVLLWADFGWVMPASTYVATQDSISGNFDAVVGALTAEVRGWLGAYKDPAKTASLVTTSSPDLGLTVDTQTKSLQAAQPLIFTDATKTSGILSLGPDLISGSLNVLKELGTEASADSLFSTTAIDQVFKNNPDLLNSPG